MADSPKVTGGVFNGGNGTHILSETPVNFASPASSSSGDTLHENGSSEVRSNGDGACSFSSPLSPKSLDFDKLNLDNSGPRFPKGGVGRYTAPFQRCVKNYNDSKRFGHPANDSIRQEGGFRTGSPFGSRAGGGGYRNSRTWMSQDAQAMREFLVIRNSMKRQFKNADVAKWKYADYVAHREAMLAFQANDLAKKVKAREDALSPRVPPISQETQQSLNKWGLLGNFDQRGNLGRVLGEPTIWCHDWLNGKDEVAPWPSTAEMKWEGDDRAKTGVGRFLPLPREEGPPGLAWNQLPCVEQYPIDQVARIPTMEDVYLPVDDQIEVEMEYLWSKDLEEAMNGFLDDWQFPYT